MLSAVRDSSVRVLDKAFRMTGLSGSDVAASDRKSATSVAGKINYHVNIDVFGECDYWLTVEMGFPFTFSFLIEKRLGGVRGRAKVFYVVDCNKKQSMMAEAYKYMHTVKWQSLTYHSWWYPVEKYELCGRSIHRAALL